MQDKKNTIHLAALVPHGNVIAQLEQERKKRAATGLLQPFYPLFCPLAFFDGFPANSAQSILLRFRDFFQSCGTLSVLPEPLINGTCLYFRLKTEFSKQVEGEAFNAVCGAGPFTLRSGSFLFGVLPDNCWSQRYSDAAFSVFEPLTCAQTLRVFKLALFTLNSSLTAGVNCSFEWTENAARWIKLH